MDIKKLNAYKVISDCKFASSELEEAEEINDTQKIKLRWFTCLALLRSVGQVLDKKDKKHFLGFERVFKEHFECKKKETIFKDFIHQERNLILKEYVDYIKEEKTESVVQVCLKTANGHSLVTANGSKIGTGQSVLVKKYFAKKEGFGEGLYLHDIVNKGIKWWELYILELEQKCR